ALERMSRVFDVALFAQLLEPGEPFLHGFLHFPGGLCRRVAATKQKGKFAHCASFRVGTSHPRRLSQAAPDIFSSSPGRLPDMAIIATTQGRYSWLWVRSGRLSRGPCPLYLSKRTLRLCLDMSASCQNRSLGGSGRLLLKLATWIGPPAMWLPTFGSQSDRSSCHMSVQKSVRG